MGKKYFIKDADGEVMEIEELQDEVVEEPIVSLADVLAAINALSAKIDAFIGSTVTDACKDEDEDEDKKDKEDKEKVEDEDEEVVEEKEEEVKDKKSKKDSITDVAATNRNTTVTDSVETVIDRSEEANEAWNSYYKQYLRGGNK